MSLLDELLQGPDAEDRFMSLASMMGGQKDPHSGLTSSAPPGGGIFGNDTVNVLDPNDPRLVTRFGVTLARPAMRSLSDVLKQYGYHGDAGGGYRSTAEQAALRAAKPGLAAPVGGSYHQEGLAIDLAAALQNARFARLMRAAGWNQFSPSGEPWHWSFGVRG